MGIDVTYPNGEVMNTKGMLSIFFSGNMIKPFFRLTKTIRALVLSINSLTPFRNPVVSVYRLFPF